MTTLLARPEVEAPGAVASRPAPPAAASRPSRPEAMRPSLRRSVAASYIGSAVEFYDFFIYATAAALVFPTVFFPNLSPTMAAVASLGSFATAFVARPFGALVFGHFGDRLGRKRTLMATLLLMGFSTVAVGLLPSTATIGIAAPLLLVALRLVQGFAVGGEWAGAALLCVENAPRRLRGRCCMVMQLGIGTAVVLANLVFLVSQSASAGPNSAFLSWGWRMPFLLSAVLIAVGFYIRRHVEETAQYTQAAEPASAALPIAELLRGQGKQLLLAAGAVVGAITMLYQASTFLTGYAESHLHVSKHDLFAINAAGGVCLMAGIVVAGLLVDRFGGRRIAAVAYLLAVPWSLAILPLIQTGYRVHFTVAVLVSYTLVGLVMPSLTGLIPGAFAVRTRYTGAAMSNNLGAIVGGALPPVISPLLMEHDSSGVTALMVAFSVLSLVSVLVLRDVEATGHPAKDER
ncbi:MAG: MFS transporter [Mycobacterium sp.]|mgnify:CR=1 FL=1